MKKIEIEIRTKKVESGYGTLISGFFMSPGDMERIDNSKSRYDFENEATQKMGWKRGSEEYELDHASQEVVEEFETHLEEIKNKFAKVEFIHVKGEVPENWELFRRGNFNQSEKIFMVEIAEKKEENIVNLTPHEITLGGEKIPASGQLARVKEKVHIVSILNIGDLEIPVIRKSFGAVEGLAGPEQGTIYIVSRIVISALEKSGDIEIRPDVFSIGETTRDENGRINGAISLAR